MNYKELNILELEDEKYSVLQQKAVLKGEIIEINKQISESHKAFHNGGKVTLENWEYTALKVEVGIKQDSIEQLDLLLAMINNRVNYLNIAKTKFNVLIDYLVTNNLISRKVLMKAIEDMASKNKQ